MLELSLTEIAKALNTSYEGKEHTCRGVSIDSRTLMPGNIFFAIKGPAFDGHDFISEVAEKGAAAVVVDHAVEATIPQLIVNDTQIALGVLARYWREKFTLPVVGLTGSAGKTTTKQMLGSILSKEGSILISEGNKNNYFGVPLTLFQLNDTHDYAVIEMGADRPGEITYLTRLVQPQVAIITNVAGVHLEVSHGVGFNTIDGVFREKTQIFSLLPAEGVAVLNADDHYYPQWLAQLSKQNHISFGLENSADVTAKQLKPNQEMQYNFDLITPIGQINLTLSSMGKHNVMNALAASAAALSLGISLEKIKAGLEQVPLVARRMMRYAGKKGALLIDDSYNANVKSVPAVMEVLANFSGKRIMIFGDMREIGATSAQEHYKIGEKAKLLKLDYFFAYGKDSAEAVKAFGKPGQFFSDQQALIAAVLPLLDKETVVAIKGSFGMKMNAIVEALKE